MDLCKASTGVVIRNCGAIYCVKPPFYVISGSVISCGTVVPLLGLQLVPLIPSAPLGDSLVEFRPYTSVSGGLLCKLVHTGPLLPRC